MAQGLITSYNELQSHIADTLNRDDLSSTVTAFSPSSIPAMIQRAIAGAEERIQHDLIAQGGHRRMEAISDSIDTVGGTESVTLPSDCAAVRSFSLALNPYQVLDFEPSVNNLFFQYPETTTSRPVAYSIVGTKAYLRPVPDAVYDCRIVYYQNIPNLSASQASNWVLVNALGVYTAAAMVELELYLTQGGTPISLQYWQSFYSEKLNQLIGDERMVRYGAAGQMPSVQVPIA